MFLVQFYILLLLILLFQPVNSLTKRSYHTANYVKDKIYFIGGMTRETDTAKYTNDFFYLDVSVPFSTNSDLPIFNLNSLNSYPPKHGKATSAVCGSNNDTIFMFGGEFDDINTANYVFKFDSTGRNPVNNNDLKPTRRKWAAGACNKNDLYIFGGSNDINNDTKTVFYNEFDILDISSDQPNWKSVSNISFLPGMDIATATMLPDGKIVYLGGNIDDTGKDYVSMTKITLYDTNNGNWTGMSTVGYEPKARGLHTAVLTNDGRIIVFGGEMTFNSSSSTGSSIPASDPLIVLDTTTNPFQWSNIPLPGPTVYRGHTATLVDNYMFVAFGASDNSDDGTTFSDEIYILDVSDRNNYKWVTNFTPQQNQPPHPKPKKPKIIGYIVSGIVVMLAITAIAYLLYRRYRQKSPIPTAGTRHR